MSQRESTNPSRLQIDEEPYKAMSVVSWNVSRGIGRTVVLAALLALSACPQVPRQAVVLSATVGRDLAVVHAAHRETVRLLFERMRVDIDRFVDEQYAPFIVNFVMEEDRRRASSRKPEERSASILLAIDAAFGAGAPPEQQQIVAHDMGLLVDGVRRSVETMRKDLLSPLDVQESEVVSAIDRAYQRIEYANSVVTGHLASVAEVHEVQDELLSDVGVSRDVRGDLGRVLADASDGIGEIVEKVEDASGKVISAKEKADQLKAKIVAIGQRIAPHDTAKE